MTATIALVTGARRGIGLATTRSLVSAGHHVVAVDRTEINAADLFDRAQMERITTATADVTDQESLYSLKGKIERELGPVSILVNNAGISPKKANGGSAGILEVSEAEWAKVMAVNVTSVMLLSQLFLPRMKDAGFGRIVNVASLAGRAKSLVAGPSYMASKAAVIGLTRSIASELGPFGVTANCVAPGRILTEMAQQAGEEVNRRYAEQIPVRRLGTADEVGQAIAFLCGRNSGFINGAIIDINGGFYMP